MEAAAARARGTRVPAGAEDEAIRAARTEAADSKDKTSGGTVTGDMRHHPKTMRRLEAPRQCP